MKQLIQEIIDLLRDKLPGLDESLNPPATKEELRKTGEVMGVTLPSELRDFYLLHNGEKSEGPGLFFGLRFLSLTEMLEEWRIWADLEEEYAEEGDHYSVPAKWIKERYINRYWVPISKDGGGNNLGIDLDPDENGVRGQVINFGRDEHVKYVIARNFNSLLEFIRDTIQKGEYSVQEDEEEGFRYWSYGREEEVHFFDVLRKLELPVLEPFGRVTGLDETEAWFSGLSQEWQERIQAIGDTPTDFLLAKRLFFIREGLTDIAPLAQCKELRELVLSGNEIRYVEALSGCQHLKQLYLVNNPVSDLQPLARLEQLQELNIAGTAVTDLTPLRSLAKLKKVDAGNTAIRDFSSLKPVRSLRVLKVSGPDREQLHSLAELTQLQELTLSGLDQLNEDDLTILEQLVNLHKLELEGAHLPHLAFLQKYRYLKELSMKDSSVEDISALARLERLQVLELSNCPEIGNLEELAHSVSLKQVAASFQQFALLKNCFNRKIDFSKMIGRMTEEESAIWRDYLNQDWS